MVRGMTQDWFTIERTEKDTFVISEYAHWEQTHCYLLLGESAAALVDTGLGVGNILEVIRSITPLPVTVLTTHAHWDHIGGHRHFERIAVHEAEASWLAGSFPLPLQIVKQNLTARPCHFPSFFSVDEYALYCAGATRILHDGDDVDLGGRRLTVVHTPGHSPGHCCFYEPDRKTLYSGDLVYQGCLDAFYPTTDPRQFYASVRRIGRMDIERIFPGHYQLNIPASIIKHIEKGFEELDSAQRLTWGSGIFDFGSFQIHI